VTLGLVPSSEEHLGGWVFVLAKKRIFCGVLLYESTVRSLEENQDFLGAIVFKFDTVRKLINYRFPTYGKCVRMVTMGTRTSRKPLQAHSVGICHAKKLVKMGLQGTGKTFRIR
jgi:hypothetical protein